MFRLPPSSTRTDTPFPYTTLFRSAETIVDAASLIAVAATRMSVSDTLRWPADDRVDEFKTPELYAIGRALGGGHAVQRLADQYAKVLKDRSEEHTSELQSLMRISYAVFCLKKQKKVINITAQ